MRGWRLKLRDPELRRALGQLSEREGFGHVRRCWSQSRKCAQRDWAQVELLGLEAGSSKDLRRVELAFAIYNRLGHVVTELAPDEYVSVRVAGEALRKGTGANAGTWPPALKEVIAAAAPNGADPAIAREALAFVRQEYTGKVLHDQARRRAKARVLLLLVPVLVALIAGFIVLIDLATGQKLVVTLLVAIAGALGSTLSGILRLRDLEAGLGALKALKSVMVIQPLVGAAFGLLVALILKGGFAGVELPTDAKQQEVTLAIFGFVAGFSEPFALGIVKKVAACSCAVGAGGPGAGRKP